MSEKEQLHHLIDQLPESEIAAAKRFLQFLAAHEAPLEPDMLARIDGARANPSLGIPHEEILAIDTSDRALRSLLKQIKTSDDPRQIKQLSDRLERVIFHKQFENA